MKSWQQNALTEFDRWSKVYDRSPLQRFFFRPSHRMILEVADIQPGARVLDIGCGTGQFLCRLAHLHPEISLVGLDLSEKMLDGARDNCAEFGDRIELVCGDSEALPFEPGSFDLVTCTHSFHHYPQQAVVASEMRRVLKPGGQAVVVDANRDNPWGWFVFDGIVATIERHVHHCSARRFRMLFTGAGFETVEQTRANPLLPILVNRAVVDANDGRQARSQAA